MPRVTSMVLCKYTTCMGTMDIHVPIAIATFDIHGLTVLIKAWTELHSTKFTSAVHFALFYSSAKIFSTEFAALKALTLQILMCKQQSMFPTSHVLNFFVHIRQ